VTGRLVHPLINTCGFVTRMATFEGPGGPLLVFSSRDGTLAVCDAEKRTMDFVYDNTHALDVTPHRVGDRMRVLLRMKNDRLQVLDAGPVPDPRDEACSLRSALKK
jgi:hypothetical protein